MGFLLVQKSTFSYTDRPVHLGLPTLKYRRLRGDMIEVFKMIKHIYDHKVASELGHRGSDGACVCQHHQLDLTWLPLIDRLYNWSCLAVANCC